MKDKNIRIEGNGWSIRAIAIGVPSNDVAISISLNYKLRNSEVAAKVEWLNERLLEWWEESRMDPKHFIKHIKSPYYGHNRPMSMVFVIELSVLTRKVIEAGRGENCFQNVFIEELDRLVEYLGLEQ